MRGALIAGGLLALTLVGFLVVGGTAPYITVPPDHLWDVGGYTITNTLLAAWLTMVVLIIVAVVAGPRMGLVPSGFSGFIEMILSGFYGICASMAGEQHTRRFFPLVGTIFFYILVSNYFGLLPMNAVIGVPEPNHGDTQVVFHQTTVAGIDLAYFPLKAESIDVGAGEHPLLPEGVELEHGAEAEHEGEGAAEGTPAGTPAGHGANLTTPSESLVSANPAGTSLATVAGAEGAEVERTTDGRFSGILAPYFRSVMTDITAPLAIAIFSFIFVEFWGLQSLGLGYLKKFFAFGAILKKGPLGLIDIFVGLLEMVSELSRMISFTFRLFGNIFAGSVLMLMMTFLTPFVLILPFYGLELFVGAIQAFVFAVLTLVFAMSAVAHHGDDEHHVEEHGGAH